MNIPEIKKWNATYSLYFYRFRITGGEWVLRKHRGVRQFRLKITEEKAHEIIQTHGLKPYDDAVFRNQTWYIHPSQTKDIEAVTTVPTL